MGKLKYKGYTGSVEYSEEDNCLFGKVQGLTKDCITYEGNNVDELRHDFEEAVDCYLASCEQRGVKPRKPYSGVLNIRLTPEIHSSIAAKAQEKGITIFCQCQGLLLLINLLPNLCSSWRRFGRVFLQDITKSNIFVQNICVIQNCEVSLHSQ